MKELKPVYTIEVTKRVGYGQFYYLIVPDHAAGRKNRYTVYKIPSSPSGKIKIIGRELLMSQARKQCTEEN